MRNGTNAQINHFDALTSQPLNSAAILGIEQSVKHAWADPSKLYHTSRNSRQLLDQAHSAIAQQIGLKPNEVSFAPSLPFVFSHAINGLIKGGGLQDKKIVVNQIEQSAIVSTCKNYSHQFISVNSDGEVDLAQYLAALDDPEVGLAILQYANHEIGTRQPLEKIYEVCRSKNIVLLVDATMIFDFTKLNLNFDALILNPVSWQGPSGIAVLAVKETVKFTTQLPRDKRENKKFPSSPAIMLAVAAAAGLEETSQNLASIQEEMIRCKNLLIKEISQISGAQILGNSESSVSNILAASFDGIDGEALISEMDKRGFEISSGSACMADEVAPSHVLQAIGAPPQSNIRISFPLTVTQSQATDCAVALKETIEQIKSSTQQVNY
jgi:cysteine desulfurase